MLIFFDIDGTLVGNDQKIADSAKDAITRARAAGHICMVNTGRTLKLVGRDFTEQLEFDGISFGCGTMVTCRGETLLHRSFSVEESLRIIEGLRRYEIDACLEGSENNYRETDSRIYTESFRRFLRLFEKLHYGSFEEAPGKFDKFFAYVDRPEKMAAFRREAADLLDVVDRKEGYFELMPRGFSKAGAVEFTAKALGVPLTETAAIGDSSNDISMLERAHRGIAMGNATEDVKAIADYVSTDMEEDGIANALRWLGAIS